MNIKEIYLEVVSFNNEKFGFKYEFHDGLNLLTGHNSSGKSTVLSCIYYCLGLEQLIGSKGPKTLSPAITESFKYKSETYKVISSRCHLTIEAKNGKTYQLSRDIKAPDKKSDSINREIHIKGEDIDTSKYVHAKRDHEEHGFYWWLADVNNLEILVNDKEGGKSAISLYMQNVFSLSFVEQTKGWSDFFSMLPSFGIKDVKQKIVEYCLKLNSLESRLELDSIRIKKDEAKEGWENHVNRIGLKLDQLNLYIPQLTTKTVLQSNRLEKIQPLILLDGEEVSLNKYLEKLKSQIEAVQSKIDLSTTKTTTDSKSLEYKEKLIEAIKSYELEHNKVFEAMLEEKEKQKQYKEMLVDIDYDLKDFQDIKWISTERIWDKIANSQCPVCEQELESIKDKEINNEKVSMTAEFLKSQKSLYESYLVASENSIDKYRAALTFYTQKIKSKRQELNSLVQDLKSPAVFAIRAEMQELAELNVRHNAVDTFVTDFENTKEKLIELSVLFYDLVQQEKDIKELLKQDDSKVSEFKTKFIKYLNKFGYRSNGTKSINITNSGSYPLLPQVNIYGQEPQNIRFISSASDFVRSIWAYYMSLLSLGERHPGFLVFDEPGQHQMRLDSLINLIEIASGSGRQVIFAVSQDRKFEDKNVNIRELLERFEEGKEYFMQHIGDDNGCVVSASDFS